MDIMRLIAIKYFNRMAALVYIFQQEEGFQYSGERNKPSSNDRVSSQLLQDVHSPPNITGETSMGSEIHFMRFLWDWPDLGAFPVDVPQTLVLGESRLFLVGAALWAGLDISSLSSKEDPSQSLLSSRSVYCHHTHTRYPQHPVDQRDALRFRVILTVSSWTSSFLSGRMLTPPAGFFSDRSANCFSIFLAKSLILFSKKRHLKKWELHNISKIYCYRKITTFAIDIECKSINCREAHAKCPNWTI